ncbi:hypothetical protein FRB94_002553 [Tulasnella sp. JGI-2019a]|nr:hypothetical protein FRB93_010202 [Tulasnella sp. JGI-2019a]KAG9013478.1 hypothetical protein FRB94_002553 [Tulasnella sp. JGI-2019a]KAG9037322.1 hypothetical protein FRB95_005961 [Tulasnella sp. JGI-2019a]
MRKALKKVLGEEKYDFFFDKFLEYFFTKEDAKFFASLGFNCIRIPVNYRHLEDDMDPGVYLERGFQWIDRIVNICAAESVYTIIDLHTAPGGQNPDWHCDSGLHKAMFWEHIEFQDRTIGIWKAIAQRYKSNAWVAGYNPLNEPALEEVGLLLKFYERAETAIREVDPDHIIYWDGNTFAADFSKFENPLPNSVYACHDYSTFGFPNFPIYTGSLEQKESLVKTFERKTSFQEKIQGPIWNGEWGPVYASPDDGPDWKAVNEVRYRVLKDQLAIYEERKVSWSIWLYKDIGFQGMVYASPDTPYIKRLKPFLQKKKRLAADSWGADLSTVAHITKPIENWLTQEVPGILHRYPPTWKPNKHVGRLIRNILLSEELYPEYAAYFEGLSFEELDQMAASFKFENCIQRQGLNDAIKPKPSME